MLGGRRITAPSMPLSARRRRSRWILSVIGQSFARNSGQYNPRSGGLASPDYELQEIGVTVVRTTDHIAVTVRDLDRSLAFYCGLLGLREVERHRLEGAGISKMAGKPGTVMRSRHLRAG